MATRSLLEGLMTDVGAAVVVLFGMEVAGCGRCTGFSSVDLGHAEPEGVLLAHDRRRTGSVVGVDVEPAGRGARGGGHGRGVLVVRRRFQLTEHRRRNSAVEEGG